MKPQLLHIFRNTPFGRETLLESSFFCQKVGVEMVVYIPVSTKFLMYFENEVVQIDLNGSYLTDLNTAREHACEITRTVSTEVEPVFFTPRHYTASTLPDIPTDFDYLCCPRSIVDMSSKIGLGYVGPRVRKLIMHAKFPVYIPNPVFKEWKSLAVFFGGSANAVMAVRLAMKLKALTGVPMQIFSHFGNGDKAKFDKAIKDNNLEEAFENWTIFENGRFEVNLYKVPHDALVILGAYGHGLIKELTFGSTMELIQSVLPNSMVVAGPQCRVSA